MGNHEGTKARKERGERRETKKMGTTKARKESEERYSCFQCTISFIGSNIYWEQENTLQNIFLTDL